MAQVSMEATVADSVTANDRRRSGREAFVVRVTYSTIDELFSEFTRDINQGGLFIETDRPQLAGTEVSMSFALPGSVDLVETTGRVVRVSDGTGQEPAGMGIEFDPLNRATSFGINQLIRSMRTGFDASSENAS